VVEETTGRKVRAYISQIHIDPEVSIELFLFESELPGDEAGG
jgi:hypothetical protein